MAAGSTRLYVASLQEPWEKTIACDRCGVRLDHIPKKCPECGEEIYDRMDPHVRERILEKLGNRPLVRPVFIYVGVAVLLIMLCFAIIMPLVISPACDCSPETNAIGTLSATSYAQGMCQQKYNAYGTFGDLYNAGFLLESTFNVGNASAYKYGYTFTLTVTSSNSWKCVGVPDNSNDRQFMIDETGVFYLSEDKGRTWTPLGQ